MFLRSTSRKKNGKTHVYWNIVENKRLDDGRVVQRQVLYLGEINSSLDAWRRAIAVIDESTGEARNPRAVSGGPGGGGEGRGRSPGPPLGDAALPSSPMGRVLAGRTVVARP
jgi:hypothetical protein